VYLSHSFISATYLDLTSFILFNLWGAVLFQLPVHIPLYTDCTIRYHFYKSTFRL
jgi:hypothetical protein